LFGGFFLAIGPPVANALPPLYCPVKPLPQPDSKPRNIPKEIQAAFALIADPLAAVEARIREQAREFDPSVEDYVAYACESNGKRLRPALVLLTAGATGGVTRLHETLAVVLELIHAASLVHDDVMDDADLRRNQPTAKAKWGNTLSVLLGDCIFAHALKLSAEFTQAEVVRQIAYAASDVCNGEIIQTRRRFDLSLTEADYDKIIGMKTAALFAAATELGARLNECPPETVAAMAAFGLKLGTAYQIYDDCLDIAGDPAQAGKTLGSDLRKGKLTLPVLLLLQNAPAAERAKWERVILGEKQAQETLAKGGQSPKSNAPGIPELVEATCKSGALQASIQRARELLHEAAAALETLPENAHRSGLLDLCGSVERLLRQFV
jgi:octaprenyl-diphosphate synthase